MKKIILILCCVIVSACTFQTKHRGYVFPNDLDEKIATVKTTAQLEDLIGSPQVKTVHGETVWIYFGEDENYHGPFPLTYDNKTVLLAWVSGNRVIKTRVLHDDELPDIKMDDDETEIPAAIELNAMEELFNNIGRFSPAGLGQ